MADYPYFKFYPSDFMGSGKVRMMTAAEKGIYIALLCHSWQEGPLPDDPSRLARACSVGQDEMEKAWPAVRQCFERRPDGFLVSEKLEKERADAIDRREKARKAARAKHDADASANAHADAGANAGAWGGAQSLRIDPAITRSPEAQKLSNSETQNPDRTGIVEKSLAELRKEARGLIVEHMLLGEEVTKSGRHTLEIEDQLSGWDQMAKRPGWDPESLNLAIANIRPVLPPSLADKPVGFGVLRTNGNAGILEEARNAGYKRQEAPP